MMETILLIPDCHRPYHDERAWSLVLKVGKALKPDRIVVFGDFADFFSVSSHDKDPRRVNRLSQELPSVLRGLDDLDAIGAKHKNFIAGNHEHRLARFLTSSSPALADLPHLTVPALFGLRERGWSFTPYKDHLRIGKVSLTHDCGFAGKYAVHHTGAAFASNVLFGHTHRMGVHYFGDERGRTHVAASLGWLGSKQAADYMYGVSINRDWQHGFGVAHMEMSGTMHLQAVPIILGKCVVNGKLYK